MLKQKKVIIFMVLMLLVLGILSFFVLKTFWTPSVPDAPLSVDAYSIGEDQAPSLDAYLEEENGELKTVEAQKDSEEEAVYTYSYQKLGTPGSTVEQYANCLTAEEEGFCVVNENRDRAELPDFTASKGTVRLVKDSTEEGSLFEVEVSWENNDCIVTVGQPEGVLKPPTEPMTQKEAVDYFKSLKPSSLGLSAKTMEAYQVFPMEGIVFVNGNACFKMSVYENTETRRVRDVEGIYFMTGDKSHIYHLDQKTYRITEVFSNK